MVAMQGVDRFDGLLYVKCQIGILAGSRGGGLSLMMPSAAGEPI
jgi:hypothetical protein